jgi:hypothetical protein
MRCSDGHYYVVKFQNNPQHRRILVNELLGTSLAARLGLPTVPVAIVDVSEELIRLTPELAMELPRARIPCQPGPQFGARYPGDPREVTLHDFLPDERLREVRNLHEFAGMLVFDKWTCNTNGRQTVFFNKQHQTAVRYEARMIDQGFCFNAGEWNFPDAPLRACTPAIASTWALRGWNHSRRGLREWNRASTSGFSTRLAGRFRRRGTRMIKTRCSGCSSSFIDAVRACRI